MNKELQQSPPLQPPPGLDREEPELLNEPDLPSPDDEGLVQPAEDAGKAGRTSV